MGYGGGSGSGGGGQEFRAGDWNCRDCNAHNFASRAECFRCNARK